MTDPRIADALCESFYSDTDLIGLGDAVDGLAPGDDIFGAMADALAATPPMAELLSEAEVGRAVMRLPEGKSWDIVYECPVAIPDDLPPYGVVVWDRRRGQMARGRGSTIQAAIEAALGDDS